MAPIRLRPVGEADLPALFEQQRDPTAHRMAAFTSWDPEDRDAFVARWRRILSDPEVLSRVVLADGIVVGTIARYLREGQPEVTYWIGREHWGKGFASAALRAFLEEVPERPLFAAAAADNVASIRVLEKCGFRTTGRERSFARGRGAEVDEVFLRLDAEVGAREDRA